MNETQTVGEIRFVDVGVVYDEVTGPMLLLVLPAGKPWRLPMGTMERWEPRDQQAMFRLLRAQTGMLLTCNETWILGEREERWGYLSPSVEAYGTVWATSTTGLFCPEDPILPVLSPGPGFTAKWVPLMPPKSLHEHLVRESGAGLWGPHHRLVFDIMEAVAGDSRFELSPATKGRSTWESFGRIRAALREWWLSRPRHTDGSMTW